MKKDGSVDLYSGGIRVLLGDRIHFDEQLSNLAAILDKLKGMKGMLHMERYSLTDRRVVFEKEE